MSQERGKTEIEVRYKLSPEQLQRRISRVNLDWNESAHRKASTELYSGEAQHVFLRRLRQVQTNLHQLFVLGGATFSFGFVAESDRRIRSQFEKSTKILNETAARIDDCLYAAGVTDLGIGDLKPLVVEVKIFSVHGRRYLELIGKFDQIVLMLEAMVSHKLMNSDEMQRQKMTCKKEVLHVAEFIRDLVESRIRSKKRASEVLN